MGNNKPNQLGKLQGEYVPIPFDDFDEAHPWDFMNQHKWVCRAASGSELSSHSDKPYGAQGNRHTRGFCTHSQFGDRLHVA